MDDAPHQEHAQCRQTKASIVIHGWETFILRSRLDLVAVRRQLIALRSLHSHDRRITSLINNLIAKSVI
jgi:hypothetical protein